MDVPSVVSDKRTLSRPKTNKPKKKPKRNSSQGSQGSWVKKHMKLVETFEEDDEGLARMRKKFQCLFPKPNGEPCDEIVDRPGRGTTLAIRHLNTHGLYDVGKATNLMTFGFTSTKDTTNLRVEPDSLRDRAITRLFLYWIVKKMVPFETILCQEFKQLTMELGWQSPGRVTLANLLSITHRCLQDHLKAELRNALSISLTLDAWTNKKQVGFITFTVHWIAPNWVFYSSTSFCFVTKNYYYRN